VPIALQNFLQSFFPAYIARYVSTESKDENVLMPAENEIVREYVSSRKIEFATGRYCAREALKQLGLGKHAILKGAFGEPLWPEGITGSISHTVGLTIAAVARQQDCRAIGLDVETIGRIVPEMWEMFFQPGEIAFLRSLSLEEQFMMSTMIFGMKEAFYKMLFPLLKNPAAFEHIDFHDVRIRSRSGRKGEVEMKSYIDLFGQKDFKGKFQVVGNYVVCFCSV
jgi:4'-phosphopantetheinyl transferase EntD